MLARGGRMSLLGLPDGAVTLDLNDQVIFKEARLYGVTGREMFRTWQQTTTLLATGRGRRRARSSRTGSRWSGSKRRSTTTASGRSGKVILFAREGS